MVLSVEIINRASPKPFLGGWRNVARDIEYHDAVSQTPSWIVEQLSTATGKKPRVSVPVQTSSVERRSRSVLADLGGVDRAVQAGACFPELTDRLVSVEEAKVANQRRRAALAIQRWYRLHRRLPERQVPPPEDYYADGKVAQDDEDEDGLEEDEEDEEEEEEEEIRSIPEIPCISARSERLPMPVLRTTNRNPTRAVDARSRDDADLRLLRTLLERWAEAEEERIRSNVPASRLALERAEKLAREIEYLRAIESSRSEAARSRAEFARAKFLNDLAKPVDLEVSLNEDKKSKVKIETLSVQRAQEFRDFYAKLEDPDQDEAKEEEIRHRTELLYALKRMSVQHTCAASLTLENLIDQELFLLESKVEPSKLRPLRSRIRLGFLRLARGVLMRGNDRLQRTSRTRMCQSCGRLKRIEAFEIDHRQIMGRTCADCVALRPKRPADQQADSDIYESMLRELRRSEAARPNGSCSLAYAVSSKTIGYLVADIWHSRSAISECGDLGRLRLVRLDPDEPWAPWNTLLATRREARMHEALGRESVQEAYGAELLRKFRRMNLQARLYFQRMSKNEESGLCL